MTISYETVLSYLNCEIDYSLKQQTKPGWSRWAIFTAISGIVWLIFAVLTKDDGKTINDQVSILNIGKSFLVIAFIFNGIYDLVQLLNRKNEKTVRRPSRFISLYNLRHARIMMIYQSSFFALLGLVFQRFPAPMWILYTGWFYLVFNFLVAALAFLLSFTDYPFIASPKTSFWGAVQAFVLASLPIIIGLGLINVYKINSVPELKLAALALCLYWLFFILLFHDMNSPLMDSLIKIRRELCFGRFDPVIALKQAEIAIEGMSVNDVLHKDISEYISLFDDMNKIGQNIKDKVSTLQTYENKNLSKDEKVICGALLQTCEVERGNAAKMTKIVDKKLSTIGNKVEWLGRMDSSSKPEISEVISKMAEATSQAKKAWISIIGELEKAKALIDTD